MIGQADVIPLLPDTAERVWGTVAALMVAAIVVVIVAAILWITRAAVRRGGEATIANPPLRRILFRTAAVAGSGVLLATVAWLVGVNVRWVVSSAMGWLTPTVTLLTACLLVAVTLELLARHAKDDDHDATPSPELAEGGPISS